MYLSFKGLNLRISRTIGADVFALVGQDQHVVDKHSDLWDNCSL